MNDYLFLTCRLVHHVKDNPFATGTTKEGVVVLAKLEHADGDVQFLQYSPPVERKKAWLFLLSLSMLMAMSSSSSMDALSNSTPLFSKSLCTLF
jgi:hypothetical protein